MNHGYSMYNQVDINTSNPLKVVLMLYDGAINFLKKAIDYAEQGDIKNKNIYANMARDIIVEFNNSLDIEAGGEIAKGLRSLYFFMNRQLMESNWNNDVQGLSQVVQLLSSLREGWQHAYNQKMSVDQQSQHQAGGLRI